MISFYTIDTVFLHQKLVLQILDSQNREILERKLTNSVNYTDDLKDIYINTTFTDGVISYLVKNKTLSLEERLVKGETLKLGELIWFENDFYFKGIGKAYDDFRKGISPAYSEFHITLERFNKLSTKGKFNFEHTFGNSALDRLSGHKNKFIFAYIDEIKDNEIVLRPIIIGDKILTNEIIKQFDTSSLKVNIEDIDELKEVASISYNDKSLDLNIHKSIPEKDIKKWFAEILNEKNVTKDWGGETSDLVTSHIHVMGKRLSGAFALKGPSKFHPMSIKDLGKNGDQIVRLFNEPADLLILQHCHYIKSETCKTMEAFASRFDNIRRYCIIDGIDTLRILKAYGKIK